MKILVADDDGDLLALIGFALAQASYLVVKASDGPGANRLFDAELPDLVILDINMPGATGFQVCEAIRARSAVPIMRFGFFCQRVCVIRTCATSDAPIPKAYAPKAP